MPFRRHLGRALLVVVAAALLTATAVVPAEAANACPKPRCRDVTVPLPTGVRVPTNKVRIVLPKGYASSKRRYPVVYLLHGRGDRYTTWTQKSDLLVYSANLPVIFVMADGGQNATAGWYSDWADGTYQFESYQIDVLMPWVDAHLRTVPGADGVIGTSMGGTGALTLAARHPGVFRAVASFSGVLDTAEANPYEAGGIDPGMLRAWGDPLLNADVWASHNPAALLPAGAVPGVFLACGTGKTAVPPAALGSWEKFVYQQHTALLPQLDAALMPYADDLYPNGEHAWKYWDLYLHWAMPQILPLLLAPPPPPPPVDPPPVTPVA